MHRKWEAHKCGTCAGSLAAPSHSAAFVCFFWTVHSYCFLLFHTIFPMELSSRNTFMTAGYLTNSFASPSMCASLPMINSLKWRLPRSLFWIAENSSLHSCLFYCCYSSNFFSPLPFFRQIIHPGAVQLVQRAKALFDLRFLYYCCSKTKPKRSTLISLLSQTNINVCINTCIYWPEFHLQGSWYLQLLNTWTWATVYSINSAMPACIAPTKTWPGRDCESLYVPEYHASLAVQTIFFAVIICSSRDIPMWLKQWDE